MSAENKVAQSAEAITRESSDIEGVRKTSYIPGSEGINDWYRKEGVVEINGEIYGFAYERDGKDTLFGYEQATSGETPCLRYIDAEQDLSQIEELEGVTDDPDKLETVVKELERSA